MSGERILADTNILIRMFSNEKAIVDFLDGADVHVSFITEIELLATSRITDAQAKRIRAFLDQCIIVAQIPKCDAMPSTSAIKPD